MLFTSVAHAMGQAPAQAADGPMGNFGAFIPLILMFAVFYFMLIRPQQKKAKEHQAMLGALKPGDRIITSGGLYGRITELNDDTAVIDLGDTKVTIGRGFIAGVPAPKIKKADDKAEKK